MENIQKVSPLISSSADKPFSENILDAPEDEMLCYCSGVTKGRILEAIRAGAATLEEVKLATGACTVGKCKELSPRKR